MCGEAWAGDTSAGTVAVGITCQQDNIASRNVSVGLAKIRRRLTAPPPPPGEPNGGTTALPRQRRTLGVVNICAPFKMPARKRAGTISLPRLRPLKHAGGPHPAMEGGRRGGGDCLAECMYPPNDKRTHGVEGYELHRAWTPTLHRHRTLYKIPIGPLPRSGILSVPLHGTKMAT